MTKSTVYSNGLVIDSPEIAASIDDEMDKARFFRDLDQPVSVPTSPPQSCDAMFPGLLGDCVNFCTRNSEAVPVAVGAYVLAWFSALVGPLRYLQLGAERRRLNIYYLLNGPTGQGKGTSEYPPKALFKRVEEVLQQRFYQAWQRGETDGIAEYPSLDVHEGGLSSGEGLAMAKTDRYKPSGKSEEEIEVADKRFLIIESEFGNILNMAERQGNTLSHVLRNGFDFKTVQPLTKRDKVCVTDPYFVLVGSITPTELGQHRQTAVMSGNGMLNRMLMLWTCSDRCCAWPEPLDESMLSQLAERIAHAVLVARNHSFETHFKRQFKLAQKVRFTTAAHHHWYGIYQHLKNLPDCESVRMLCQRHRLHVLIIASLLALLDGREAVDVPDLDAALLWSDYSRQSVLYTHRYFNEQQHYVRARQIALGILRAVTEHGQECTLTDISQWFGRRIPKEQVQQGMNYCLHHIPPLIKLVTVKTGKRGRPAEKAMLTASGQSYLLSESQP